ncbi:MAG: hydroxyacid dehydrogenase [Elusimicrobia bacterium]|nr:hydroxyacid dehydrogenase [Elusimicrobiota bacterium]
MKIAFLEINDWEIECIKNSPLALNNEFLFFQEELSEQYLSQIKSCDILSVFIYSKVSKEVISQIQNLKFIATRSTGFDHIDLETCKKKGIVVANVPFYGENTVAEHTFALILSLSRNVHKAFVRTVKGDFSLNGLKGFDLKGKTLGVVGAGHIGLHVIRMARGFGMEVLAFDVNKNHFLEEVLGFNYADLEFLLAHSDIVSLHAPYNAKTHHLINRQNIKKIKRGALLVNTARGALIDTHALVEALDEGILAGAGLDALEDEDLIKEEKQILSHQFPQDKLETLLKNHILLHRENVVITPHIAFYSQEAMQRILDTTINNISSFISNKSINTVA